MSATSGERPPTEVLLDRALRTAFTARPPPAHEGAPDATLPPERVCRVEAEIARGGMGVVYRARDPVLGREVALKLLREDLAQDDGAVRRFLEEARIGGCLQHPGVVPVYALGRTTTGRPWFTMKLIEGVSFAERLHARAAPSEHRRRHLAILESVCRTVAYAHDRGVVHLDLKPGNVMVGAFGEVQVVDWGLAALVRSSQPGTRPLGRDGEVYGTPAYMPPEQARGEFSSIDVRADVFALGAILCEVLTGEPPYAGGREASRRAAADADLAGALERLAASDAPDLAALCAECLAASPLERRTGAGGIASAIARHFATLEERLRGAEIAAAEARTRAEEERRARRLTISLAGSVIVSILLLAGAWAVASARETSRRAGVDARGRGSLEEAARLLGQAETSGDPALYASAAAAAERAQAALAAGEGSPVLAANASALLERIRAESASRALLGRLDALRVPDDPGGELERDRAYADALAAAGLDPDGTAPEEFAEVARARGIAVPLAAAFDEWIDLREAACLLPGADRLRVLARHLDPDPARSRLRDLLARGSFEQLVDAIEAVDLSEVGPGTIHALDRALRARGVAGLWEAPVEALYDRALPSHLEDPTLCVELARLRFARRDSAGGERLYRVALALRPDHPVAWAELAWELEHLDIDVAAAVELGGRAVELAPEEGLYRFALGRSLRRIGDLDGAAAAQAEAARCMPSDPRPHKELAVILREKGAPEEALVEFRRALAISPLYEVARQEYADTLSERGRLDEAIAEVRAGMELDPRGRSGWASIAARLRIDHGDYAGAVLEMRRETPASPAAILPLHERGVRLEDFLDLESMQAICERSVERLPREAILHAQLGAILEARGRFGEALAEFRTAHALGTQQPGWRQPSLAWLERAARWAEIERAMQGGEPRDAAEAEAFGRIAFRQGRFEESARWFTAALDGRPGEDFSRLEAACAAVQLGSEAWGERARAWLAEDLDLRARQIETGGPAAIAARRVLGAWTVAGELAGAREEALWRELWTAVHALAAR